MQKWREKVKKMINENGEEVDERLATSGLIRNHGDKITNAIPRTGTVIHNVAKRAMTAT